MDRSKVMDKAVEFQRLRKAIDPKVLEIFDHQEWGEGMRGRKFEELGRRPTIDEIRYDFAYGYHAAAKPNDSWCLDPLDAIHVLLARIDELERGNRT